MLLTADCAETWQDAALAEDSGAPSQNRGTISPNRLAVCITPSEYPSYLKEISVYTVNNTTNETAFFEVYLDPDGNGPPEGDPIWTGTNFTPASSTWTSQDLTGEAEFDVPIHAGSWCLAVGYNAATGYPFVGADPADPLLHSFKGTSGSWTTDPSGYRYYIRGVVESCLPATTTTTTTTTTSSSSTTTTTAPATTTTTDPGTTTTTTPGNHNHDGSRDNDHHGAGNNHNDGARNDDHHGADDDDHLDGAVDHHDVTGHDDNDRRNHDVDDNHHRRWGRRHVG
ncbi:MAG: hypothetical protein M5R36_17640 [Deltaproteobacteria bacterium]|nr:hypothetical protein [Deltaproteobacteria bacterium]